jgi:hypothetical protein
MWAQGVRVRVPGLFVVALAVAVGCADRAPRGEGAAPPAGGPSSVAPPGTSPPVIAAATVARRSVPLRPPVAMPGGGVRIDMRGTRRHVRAVERQPDGTFKHVCTDEPDTAPAGGPR